MKKRKYELLSAEETAEILGISLERLYRTCDFFDKNKDDEWELIQGEHFEWLSKNLGTRRFHEEGAMIIAKYIQETDTSGLFLKLIDTVIEKITHRRKRTRQLLVKRRIIKEMTDLNSVEVRGELVFLTRPQSIRILDTNGKGLSAAARREQKNISPDGRSPLKIGIHFDNIEGREHWSQQGLVRIAKNMSENLAKKSRRAWTDAVAEIIEDAIKDQKKYLESFDGRVQRVMKKVKSDARKRCQVTLEKQQPYNAFDLHVHHLFDRSTRRDLADISDNLIVIHEELHRGFHNWNGSESCEPKHLIEYLTTVESWRFETKEKDQHLQRLINRLERLQNQFQRNSL